jgi:hypothetical protein
MINFKTFFAVSAFALTSLIPFKAQAVPGSNIEIIYYSDDTYTVIVGYLEYDCSGEPVRIGHGSSYFREYDFGSCD